MKIKKLVLSPDHEDVMYIDHLVLSANNPTTHKVSLIRVDTVFTDVDGFPISSDTHLEYLEEDDAISPGQRTKKVSLSDARVAGHPKASSYSTVAVSCTVSLFAEERYYFPDVPAPSSDGDSVVVETMAVDSAVLDGPMRATIRRTGDCADTTSLDCAVCARNGSDIHVSIVKLRCLILPSHGYGVLDELIEEAPLYAKTTGCISVSNEYVSVAALNQGRVRLSVHVYRPVHTALCSATTTIMES